ncbi:MAG: alpha/beta hydrolase [Muribaculaceae bacterium]|nr:alpha/beta hydrolase [Muribaculaceae bacterium]
MRRLPLILTILLCLGIVRGGAQRFYESWDWQHLQKAPKSMDVDTSWGNDILPGFESRFVAQPKTFDGPCRSTIIRKLCRKKSRKAFLYVHGFNDYFFQQEMGQRFVDSGYNFYAVDLRRYGRSRLPWQYPFDVRRQQEYFQDIDSALSQIRRDGNTDITLGGHSTGGLTVILYATELGARVGVKRVVTDSPFLAWNFPAFMRNIAIPSVGFMGGIFPSVKIKQSHCDGYAYSLLKEYHGEWTYNTQWKMIYSPPVAAGWIRSISKAQNTVLKKGGNIRVPLLIMHSSRKINGCSWTPEFQTGDCVLDPEQIQRRGMRIGMEDTRRVCTIDSGLHDLILSRREVRDAAYDTIFKFINLHRGAGL